MSERGERTYRFDKRGTGMSSERGERDPRYGMEIRHRRPDGTVCTYLAAYFDSGTIHCNKCGLTVAPKAPPTDEAALRALADRLTNMVANLRDDPAEFSIEQVADELAEEVEEIRTALQETTDG